MMARRAASLLVLTVLLLSAVSALGAQGKVLTVCADPNNLPFSNLARQGFENKIVEMLAREMRIPVQYVWWAQRRGYARNTLGRERCDIWPGVASGIDNVRTTRPYYRSSYVFVTRARAGLDGLSLDDERLRSLMVGIQMIGNEAMNTPPAHALARRGITVNVRGYMLYGDYARPNPPAAIVDAVAHGDIDVGLVWGPLAGYFSLRSPVPLSLQPVQPTSDGPQWPMQYAIAMGVRRDEPQLLAKLNALLAREQPVIDALLEAYQVPQVAMR
ncbi:MAG: quinoprotein dehydrogenase-associated putative ABC transporter substrate-binding protein [Steroidobacteraceae bacterium]